MIFYSLFVLAVFFGPSASQSCSYVLTDSAGGFSSPNYPGNYDNNLNCQYFIVVRENVVITLSFPSFSTEIFQDVVKVYDGPDTASPLLLEYSGKTPPPPVDSSGGVMLVVFTTDSSNSLPGFQANYIAPTNSSTDPKACNHLLTDANGILTSPNYPANYDNDVQCQWFIAAKSDEKINLTFVNLDTENTYDLIKVYDGLTSWSPLLLTISGKIPPPPILSSGGALLVVFTSDDSAVYSGFQASYKFVAYEPTSCNYLLTDASGDFSSPNFPANYENNLNCQWGIVARGNAKIKLNFVSFDTEKDVDFIKVYDGPSNSSDLLLSHSGSDVPPSVNSTSQVLLVEFTTNALITFQGFQAFYISAVDCSALFSETSGSFSSPNYPNSYDNELNCRWTIIPSEYMKINLTFNSFYTEGLADVVRVFDGPTPAFNLLLEHSGPTIPPPVISSRNALLVIFTTGDNYTFPGFQASYKRASPQWTSCNSVLTAASGELSSPNYPKTSYEDNLKCTWLISVTGDVRIKLIFNYFWTELDRDLVKVYDGSTTSSNLLLSHSGQQIPSPVVSTSGVLLVVFTTDAVNTLPGFHASYIAKAPGGIDCDYTLSSTSGTFNSLNYPANYANDLNCLWRITVQSPNPSTTQVYIKLNFTSFETQASRDVVKVYNGPSESFPLLLTHSGNSIHNAVVSSAGNLLVKFTTDASITAKGFQASYSMLTCPTDLGANSWCRKFQPDRCHCFSAVGRTWANADSFCTSKSMRLVSIETKEENDWLTNEVVSHGYPANSQLENSFWTSGSDAAVEGRWIWTATGQPLNYTNWYPYQPDNSLNEDYIAFNDYSNGKWNDRNGTNTIYSYSYTICESNQ